jgi:hypothetical protein
LALLSQYLVWNAELQAKVAQMHRCALHIAALVYLLVFASSTALAQEIPEYDSEAHCKRVAESAAKPSSTVVRCLWLEEYALDELETFWPRASGAIREECVEVASAEESYVALARCVMARLRRSR